MLVSRNNFGPIEDLRTPEELREFNEVATNTNPMVEPILEEKEEGQIIDKTVCAKSTEKRAGELYETITMIEKTGILPQEEIFRGFEREINKLEGKESTEDTLYH